MGIVLKISGFTAYYSGKGDGNICLLLLHLFGETYRDDYMNGLHKEYPFMIGIVIKVILLKSIVRLFVNMEQRHIIG